MILADVAGGRDNNFNLIRMTAASGVLVSHAFPIAWGKRTSQPFEALTGYTLGWICVAVFFAISGFLITRSFDRTVRLESWLSARITRLFPALIVVSVLIALLYGPAFTALPISEYARDWRSWAYAPRNVSLFFLQYDLPGVFANHPYPKAINGSLWTLMHEVLCYFAVFLAGMFGALRSKRVFGLLCALYFAAYFATAFAPLSGLLVWKLPALRLLSYPFVIGMMLYVWRHSVRLSWLIALALAAVAALLHGTVLFQPAFVLAIAYSTFVLAYRPGGIFRRYNEFGDYSYGMYVYAFPVQQAAIALAGPMSPGMNMAIAFPVTLLFAVASWYAVEKPSLDRRHRFAELLGRLRRRPRAGVESAA
jgi:peptidoglycan/LPS O-acetylase OafA/YrhL